MERVACRFQVSPSKPFNRKRDLVAAREGTGAGNWERFTVSLKTGRNPTAMALYRIHFGFCYQQEGATPAGTRTRLPSEARPACACSFIYRSRATRPCASWRVVRPDPAARMNEARPADLQAGLWMGIRRTIVGPGGWRSTWDFHRRLTNSLGIRLQVFAKLGCNPPPE